jgi:hypothetical protein
LILSRSFGGFLVVLFVDRLLEAVAELHQFTLRLLALRQAPRRLAAVARLTVNVLQERCQLLAELLIIVRAAQPAGVAKLDKFDPALRTFALVEGRRFFTFAQGLAGNTFDAALLLGLVEVFIGTLFAQMKLFELAFAKDFSDVQRGWIVALLALHCGDPRWLATLFVRSCAILTGGGKVSRKGESRLRLSRNC